MINNLIIVINNLINNVFDVGHEVIIVDNLSRRNIDNELECQSLTPIQPMGVRVQAWKEQTGKVLYSLSLFHSLFFLLLIFKKFIVLSLFFLHFILNR